LLIFLHLKIIALHEVEELPNLVRLRLSIDLLKIEEFRHIWVSENVVASTGPHKAEAECLSQVEKV